MDEPYWQFKCITIAHTVILGALRQKTELLLGFFYQARNEARR
jgi:hypothetical protein